MDIKLNIVQKQRLVLSQVMQQSINVLQMSAYDLREYIDEQFEENPMLEGEFREDKEILEYKEIVKYLSKEGYKDNYLYINKEDDVSPFNYIVQKKSLKDFLYEQLLYIKCENDIREIVSYMIESLNRKGYLENDIEEISRDVNCIEGKVNRALKVLQSLEPVGIGARNLKETLLIQAKSKNLYDENIKKIILNHLEDIADNKYKIISKKIGIEPKEVQKYGDIIKSLEPKPSRGFYTGEEVKFIIPDAYIARLDNDIKVIMNTSIIPRLTVNDLYVDKKMIDEHDLEYLKEKTNNAINLINEIEYRKNTLQKILECIVIKQQIYFNKGKAYLKPMILKDVAEEIGIHESTVSRAIKDKYILTSSGTVKIKDLFIGGIQKSSENSEEFSIEYIKNKIKSYIDDENKNKPLSDQIISELLKQEFIEISRRTVAKYREELGIKSSSKRKRI